MSQKPKQNQNHQKTGTTLFCFVVSKRFGFAFQLWKKGRNANNAQCTYLIIISHLKHNSVYKFSYFWSNCTLGCLIEHFTSTNCNIESISAVVLRRFSNTLLQIESVSIQYCSLCLQNTKWDTVCKVIICVIDYLTVFIMIQLCFLLYMIIYRRLCSLCFNKIWAHATVSVCHSVTTSSKWFIITCSSSGFVIIPSLHYHTSQQASVY